MTSVASRGWRWRVWRRCWVLWRLDIPKWRHQAWQRVFWPAWRVRHWERKLASEVAECRAQEAQVAPEFGGHVVSSPIWTIKESHYPSRLLAAWRWTLYRTPLTPVLSRGRFMLRRLGGVARADGRNYVGYRARAARDPPGRGGAGRARASLAGPDAVW